MGIGGTLDPAQAMSETTTAIISALGSTTTVIPAAGTLTHLKDLADLVLKIFQGLAIVVAGIWAYFKFFRNRTYRPRLELGLAGRLLGTDADRLLVCTVSAKNVGLSDVPIRQRGTGLRVSSFLAGQPQAPFAEPAWQQQVVLSVFSGHQWIEPGETISEDTAMAVPLEAYEAFKVELRIVGRKKSIAWKANAVVGAVAETARQEGREAMDNDQEAMENNQDQEGQAKEEQGETREWEQEKLRSDRVAQANEDRQETDDWEKGKKPKPTRYF
jgi:hypothetical protein